MSEPSTLPPTLPTKPEPSKLPVLAELSLAAVVSAGVFTILEDFPMWARISVTSFCAVAFLFVHFGRESLTYWKHAYVSAGICSALALLIFGYAAIRGKSSPAPATGESTIQEQELRAIAANTQVLANAARAQKEADSVSPTGPIQTLKKYTLLLSATLLGRESVIKSKMHQFGNAPAMDNLAHSQAVNEAVDLIGDYNLIYSKQVADVRERLIRAGQTQWDHDDDYYATVHDIDQIQVIGGELRIHAEALK